MSDPRTLLARRIYFTSLAAGIVTLSIGAGATVVAASLRFIVPVQRPGQATSQQAQAPARDQSLQQREQIGTASITGQVIAADTGRPLKRVRVIATASSLQGARAAQTDAEGRYEMSGLPAGTYTVTASRDGFLTGSFGGRRALRAGRPVEVGDGRRIGGIDIALQRGGVVSGHLFDEDGEPVLRASVRALRVAWGPSGRRLVAAGNGQTDDRGYYRIFGLMPGTYYVSAFSNRGTMSVDDLARGGMLRGGPGQGEETPLGYAPTYYPGTPNAGDASPVVVSAQQEVPEISFGLVLVPTVRVAGTVLNADGSPLMGGSVTLFSEEGNSDWAPPLSGGIRQDGAFAIANVPPGRYVAAARGRAGMRQEGVLYGSQSFAASGREVSLNLTLARGTQVSGTVTFESLAGASSEASQVRVSLVPADQRQAIPSPTFRAQSGGAFTLTDVHPGTYFVSVTGFSSRWALKGAYLQGRDAVDAPIEVRGHQPMAGLQVVLTDTPAEVSGTVVDSDGAAVLDCVVVVFSTDPALWRPSSRTLRVVRPDQNGGYRVRALPPGDYYVIALDDLDSDAINDPATLNALRPSASRVSLSESETQARTLRVVAAGQSS